MNSRIGTLEKIETFENRSNGQAHGDAANQTQLAGQSVHAPNNNRPSQQNALQQERLALIGTSAVVFAHEVSNPLQTIFGSLEFIETEFKSKQITDPFLTSMIHGAMRQLDRLRALLWEFRSLANAEDLNLRLADLPKIIEEVLALEQLGHRAAGVTVKLDCQAHLPLLFLDADKITQVILNLCKNAVEAMPDGGRLSLRVYRSEAMITMEIADSGVGMPGDIDVFQLFKTTKPGGSGLGLPIVQQIISAHKGTINYISELGRGTTFTVRLPVENRR
ncbi:MAG: ATP-binding protein [Deltaproteobacteria bacterium]|nr:ATP-binding protein [Deltaproteobacteria bacterium]